MKKKLTKAEIKKINGANINNPLLLLGPHKIKYMKGEYIQIRAFIPNAHSVKIISRKYSPATYEMEQIEESNIFEAITNQPEPFPYFLEIEWAKGKKEKISDPYSFPTTITEEEIKSFQQGRCYNAYEILGAHKKTVQWVDGTRFAAWAPNAKRVSVVGNFNQWDGRRHMMHLLGESGIWEIFIPNLKDGEKYKFEIKTTKGEILHKSDPYATYAEVRPNTASIVANNNSWEWHDKKWLNKRRKTNPLDIPLSIYELHLGSWCRREGETNFLNYRDMAPLLAKYVKKMGYTHIELLPIQEHPYDASWGYQVTGYFSPSSRFGTPEDFSYFVNHMHHHNIGVIIDWVPAHFPTDAHSLANFDGTSLYEYKNPKKGTHKEWGTLVFDYGKREIKNFLISSALFWCKKYHIDGIRVDAVSSMLYLDYGRKEGEWEPNIHGGKENLEAVDFIKEFNEIMHAEFPGILTVAEESTAWAGVSRPTYLGGLGFTLKWNMGWMNDMLKYISKDPVHRKHHHNDLTFSLAYAFSENFVLSISHDEVVHGKASLLSKMPGNDWEKFANLRLFLGHMFAHPGKKLLFMGNDIGQWNEWNHDKELDWNLLEYEQHQELQNYIIDLNKIYKNESSLWEIDFGEDGFEWIDSHNWEGSILSYIRKGKSKNNSIIAICNFTPVKREGYRIGLDENCEYMEIINSDSTSYGGLGITNEKISAEAVPWQGKPFSAIVTLPPLAVILFKKIASTHKSN